MSHKFYYFQVTLEEINSQIALEYGQAMTVRVLKADGEVMRKFSDLFLCLCVILILFNLQSKILGEKQNLEVQDLFLKFERERKPLQKQIFHVALIIHLIVCASPQYLVLFQNISFLFSSNLREPSLPSAIVVVQNATVLDLKKAICRFAELKQQREGGVKHISW